MNDAEDAQGYIDDSHYPTRYFRELSPAWLNYVAVLNFVAPRPLDGSFRYLELGCGSAYSSLLHAAAFPQGEFHACDINPAYIEAAQERVDRFGIGNIRLHTASFDELRQRQLPQFDFIVLHGVYSWVARDVRLSLRHLLAERIAPGGLVYVSYNCLPGWAPEMPLRRLLQELAPGEGDWPQRVDAALHRLKGMDQALLYLRANPQAATAVNAYLRSPSGYLAHEFLNAAWEPLYSVDVEDEMQQAGLSFLGSATLADNHDVLSMSAQAMQAVAALETSRQQKLATDFAVNRQFRRDVFVCAAAESGDVDAARQLRQVVLGRLDGTAEIPTKVRVPRGLLGFQERFVSGVRALLARGPRAVGEILDGLAGHGDAPADVMRNVLYLTAAGVLTPFARPGGPQHDVRRPRAFANAVLERMVEHLAHAGENDATPHYVPSGLAGGGVPLSPQEAAAVLEYVAGAAKSPPPSLPRLSNLGLFG